MTVPDPTTDDVRVEPVARVLWRIDCDEYAYDWESNASAYRDIAREALAAADATQRDARVRAEALREAAGEVEGDCARTAKVCFCGSADWLRARADRIERGAS